MNGPSRTHPIHILTWGLCSVFKPVGGPPDERSSRSKEAFSTLVHQ
jgi:hypothetical protein